MEELSYHRVLAVDAAEHEACPLKWDCANCTKTLCVQLVAVAELPSLFGRFHIIGFTNNKDGKDHTMVVKGDVSGKENVLTRVHSSCLTGDSLGSLRCDCGPQLRKSMTMIEEEGLGVLIYMQQEGRGIGLTNKLRAYQLQDGGLDTYDANIALGLPADERDYEVSAAMLTKVGVGDIRLITNNPAKVEALQEVRGEDQGHHAHPGGGHRVQRALLRGEEGPLRPEHRARRQAGQGPLRLQPVTGPQVGL